MGMVYILSSWWWILERCDCFGDMYISWVYFCLHYTDDAITHYENTCKKNK